MKTSKKILIAVGCLILVLFTAMMLLIKHAVQPMQLTAGLKHNYKVVSVDNFKKLDFSSNFIVRIKQGKECKVELAAGEDSVLTSRLKSLNGTLYLKIDSIPERENSGKFYARITMPFLKEIKAEHGAKILIENFESDSLSVILENGVEFTGKDNHFKYVSFKTPGDSWLQFKNTY